MYAFFDSKGIPRETDGDWSKADPAFPFCSNGMVTFTVAKGGLMYEATIAGQKFRYKPRK